MSRARSIFEKFVPEGAVDYCLYLWEDNNFKLLIKNKRKTKLGDYRYGPKAKTHTISVNNNLNPYAFLITYLHEVAHLKTFEKYSRKVRPHGPEWKATFKNTLQPVLNDRVLPRNVLIALTHHLKKVKAASCSDPALMQALGGYDKIKPLYLSDLKTGDKFKLGNKAFIKNELRRTRFVCTEVKSGKKYLVSKAAAVEKVA